MKIFRFVVFALLLVFAASGADVSGKWKGQMAGRDGNMRDVAFDFTVAGEQLTGSMSGMRGDVAIADGKVAGNTIQFTVTLQMNGNAFKMNYAGILESGELKMKMSTGSSPRAVEFLLKKL